MPFQLSPGVLVTERDLTNVVPAVSTSIGGYAGQFVWGPAEEITTVGSEQELIRTFGKPNTAIAASWFSAANFLSYSNNLKVVRVLGTGALNAAVSGTPIAIKNMADWEENFSTGQGSVGLVAAKFPGALGNSLRVIIVDSATYDELPPEFAGFLPQEPGTSAFAELVGVSDDELHLLVIDEDGLWTGTANTVLETFQFMSKMGNAKTEAGASNYWRDRLIESRYIVWMDNADISWGGNANAPVDPLDAAVDASLLGGADGSAPSAGAVELGYGLFINSESVDVNLLFAGPHPLSVGAFLIESVAEVRKDAIAFVSPLLASITTSAILADRVTLGVNSSYGFMDSGWKYQYDKYNDVYRWVPLNGDIAGLCARTDQVSDSWFSPGGLTRGQIKNVVKLRFSPNKTERDTLYVKGVNPVVSFPGEGTVLFGDKTLLAKPSAFDRINVRRLFITLEKAIAVAGRQQLFEFNDEFTRAQFRNMVEPFLRDVQGRRGVTDFKVICDETNNTGEVIDRNEFVADIYIKPARSINFIQLNFIATRTGISFEEIAGA